ncbi:MAG: hypothetical protein KKA54_15635 [Proteobacteria bacterium]|nr:hypothetical protein [Pseudomonadota bacterium]MBU0967803.1 hypothetical protein [Pseudomonadota bacterium]
MESGLLDFLLAFVLVILGIGFLKLPQPNVNYILLKWIKDNRVIIASNQLVFLVSLIMSLLLVLNGAICLADKAFPNFGAIPFAIGFLGSWPIKIIFLMLNKAKKYEDMPRIWPFERIPR